MELDFRGEVIEWRGPAPFYFAVVPDPERSIIAEEWAFASYGWGCIPVGVTLGRTASTTALMPRNGGYLVPLKAALRRAERVELGDTRGSPCACTSVDRVYACLGAGNVSVAPARSDVSVRREATPAFGSVSSRGRRRHLVGGGQRQPR